MASDDNGQQNYVHLKPVLKYLKKRNSTVSNNLHKIFLPKSTKNSESPVNNLKPSKEVQHPNIELQKPKKKNSILKTHSKVNMPSTPKKGGIDWGFLTNDDGLPKNKMPKKTSIKQNADGQGRETQPKLKEKSVEAVTDRKHASTSRLCEPHHEYDEKPRNRIPVNKNNIHLMNDTVDTPVEIRQPKNVMPKKNYKLPKPSERKLVKLEQPIYPELPTNSIPRNEALNAGPKRAIQPFEKRKKQMKDPATRLPTVNYRVDKKELEPPSGQKGKIDSTKLNENKSKYSDLKRPLTVPENIKLKSRAYTIHDHKHRSSAPPITVHKYTPSRTYQKEHLINEGQPTSEDTATGKSEPGSTVVSQETADKQHSTEQDNQSTHIQATKNSMANNIDKPTEKNQQLTAQKDEDVAHVSIVARSKPKTAARELPDIELPVKVDKPQQAIPQNNSNATSLTVPDPAQVKVFKPAVKETAIPRVNETNKKLRRRTSKKGEKANADDFEYREEPRLYIKPPKVPLSSKHTENVHIEEKDVVHADAPKNYRMVHAPLKAGEVPQTYLMRLKEKMKKEADAKALEKNAPKPGTQLKKIPKDNSSIRGCKLTTQAPPKAELSDVVIAKQKEELKAEALREASVVASKALREVKKIFQNAEKKLIPIASSNEAISAEKTLKEGVISLIDTMSEEAIGHTSDQNIANDIKGPELVPSLKKSLNSFQSTSNKTTSTERPEDLRSTDLSDATKPPIATPTCLKKQNINADSHPADIYTTSRSPHAEMPVHTSIWGEISLTDTSAEPPLHQPATVNPGAERTSEQIQVEILKQGEVRSVQGESNVRSNPNYLARKYATDPPRRSGPSMAGPSSSNPSPPSGPPPSGPPASGPPAGGKGSDGGSGKEPPEFKVVLPLKGNNTTTPDKSKQSVQATIKVEFHIVDDENKVPLAVNDQANSKLGYGDATSVRAEPPAPVVDNVYVSSVNKEISSKRNKMEMIRDKYKQNNVQPVIKEQVIYPRNPHTSVQEEERNKNAQRTNQNEKIVSANILDTKTHHQVGTQKQVIEQAKPQNIQHDHNNMEDHNMYYYDSTTLDADERKDESIRLAEEKRKEAYIKLGEERAKLEAIKLVDANLKIEAMKLAERLKEEAVKLAEEKLKMEAKKIAEETRKADEAKLAEEKKRAEAVKLAEQKRKAEEIKLAEEKKKAEAVKLAEQKRKAEEIKLAEEKKKAEAVKLAEQKRKAEEIKLAEEKKKAEAVKLAEQKRKAEEIKFAEEKKKAEAGKLAEQKRKAEEIKLAEKKKKAEAVKLAEQKRKAEEIKLAEEKKKAEAVKLTEQKRKAEEIKLAEEKKKAEAVKLAEQKRKAEEIKRLEGKKKAEALKLDAEKRKAEENLAADKRKAEAIRLAQERRRAEEIKLAEEKKKADANKLALQKWREEETKIFEEKKKAGATKLAEEKRMAEESKLAEEKKRVASVKLAEEKWKAEAIKLAEEKQKVEALKISEERWKAEAQKLAEERQRADTVRLADEKRKAMEIKLAQEKLKAEAERLSEERWKAEEIKRVAEKQMIEAKRILEETRKAEAQKLAEEKQKADALKLAEDKRKADAFKLAEDKRKAEEFKQAEEKRRAKLAAEKEKAEAVRAAKEKQVAEEFKQLEQKRKAEELKLAEEKKKAEAVKLADQKQKAEEMKLAEEKKKADAMKLAKEEEAKLAEQKKKAEAIKQIEEQRKAEEVKLAEQKKKDEAMKLAEENKKAEAIKLAEKKQREDEIKIAEGRKKAELMKLAEEQRKTEEVKVAAEKQKAEVFKMAEEKRKAEIIAQIEEKKKAEFIKQAEEKKRAEALRVAAERQEAEDRKIAEEQKRVEALKLAEEKNNAEAAKFSQKKSDALESYDGSQKALKYFHKTVDEREIITKLAQDEKEDDKTQAVDSIKGKVIAPQQSAIETTKNQKSRTLLAHKEHEIRRAEATKLAEEERQAVGDKEKENNTRIAATNKEEIQASHVKPATETIKTVKSGTELADKENERKSAGGTKLAEERREAASDKEKGNSTLAATGIKGEAKAKIVKPATETIKIVMSSTLLVDKENDSRQAVVTKLAEERRLSAEHEEKMELEKKRRVEALKLADVKRNAEAIKKAEKRKKAEAFRAAAENRMNEEKRKAEALKAEEVKKRKEYLALAEQKKKSLSSLKSPEEKKIAETVRVANDKLDSQKPRTIWPFLEGELKSSDPALDDSKKPSISATHTTNKQNVSSPQPQGSMSPKTTPPKNVSQTPLSKSPTDLQKPDVTKASNPQSSSSTVDKGAGTFYDWTKPGSLSRKTALHMELPIHRQGQLKLDNMKRDLSIKSANKIYQMSASSKPGAAPCPICPADTPPAAPAPCGASSGGSSGSPSGGGNGGASGGNGASRNASGAGSSTTSPGENGARPSSSMSHDTETEDFMRKGPAPLTGISKYFNSTTISGRANVAKATFAVLGLYTLGKIMKKKPKDAKR